MWIYQIMKSLVLFKMIGYSKIFENDRSNKNLRNEGSKAHSEENSANTLFKKDRAKRCTT